MCPHAADKSKSKRSKPKPTPVKPLRGCNDYLWAKGPRCALHGGLASSELSSASAPSPTREPTQQPPKSKYLTCLAFENLVFC